MFAPYFASDWFVRRSTLPYTLAFSNTPGILKPLESEGKKSRIMTNYLIPAGYTGLAIGAISYVDYFKISCVSDEAILKNP